MRLRVLTRDGRRCRAHTDGYCARAGRRTPHTCTEVATHVHHTLGKARTGDDPRWLVASCEACNLHIGDPTSTRDPQPRPLTRWGES